MRISQVEQESGFARSTIYLYQRLGLVAPAIRRGGHPAEYDEGHVARLSSIRELKDKGMSLTEIQAKLGPDERLEEISKEALVEEHAAATRAIIVDAAARVFAVKGYRGATIDEVCAAAGITPRTFYHYFPSKRRLFIETGHVLAQRHLERAEAQVLREPDPVKRYLLRVSGFLRLSSITPEMLVFLRAESAGGDETSHSLLVSIYEALVKTLVDDLTHSAVRKQGDEQRAAADELVVYALIGVTEATGMRLTWDNKYSVSDYLRANLRAFLAFQQMLSEESPVTAKAEEYESFIGELARHLPFEA
jgi:AcrR family transcriptional regulator